ncbi:hypothetical protein [Streptomyces swartbergensis]|uniref:Uncharacterized protein n=1 Tax=Streptomyces swartbergensis TaxID=487165 RepID=A0A243RA29_9ACTN|nr:hypothetical protein [Streptomyces swartbergensis]OUC91498.1 hypothetical protein CA983_39525 [Streptomyces swartbergensis]
MRLPRIERELARAQVLADEYDNFDERAGLERIARRVLWDSALSLEKRAQRIRTAWGADDRTPAPGMIPQPGEVDEGGLTALHERAAHELDALSAYVIGDQSAVAAMGLLVDDPIRIEPDGALAFACLLYLADKDEAARFWWSFAAGAGAATAAYCLYLHHLHYSELRDAQHWREWATDLAAEDHTPTLHHFSTLNNTRPNLPVPCTDPAPNGEAEAGKAWLIVESCETWRAHIRLSRTLTKAVYRLEVCDDADYGTIPRPDPELAAELEECAGSAT